MALAPDARLDAYEVTAQIGEGGMGQVYRARDTKLNRDVALKILPGAFASDRPAHTLTALRVRGINDQPNRWFSGVPPDENVSC